jgi:hypothetical protein
MTSSNLSCDVLSMILCHCTSVTTNFLRGFAMALVLSTAALTARAETTLTSNGWTVAADPSRHCLTIRHERIGTLLDEVRLGVASDERPGNSQLWSADSSAPGCVRVRTSEPGSTWLFECTPEYLRISSTDPGAVLTGVAPVPKGRRVARLLAADGAPVTWQGTGEVAGTYGGSMTRNLSFLPRENPECMYFGLGHIAGSVFHDLFDSATDTAVRFPEQTRFQVAGPDRLRVQMPLPGPGLVRVVPDYYTKVLGVPYYVPFDDSVFPRAPMVWCSWTSYYADVTEDRVVQNTDWLAQHLKPYGFQYIQIDDGYDRSPKEGHYWIEHWDTNKFPKGPQWITAYIKSKGLHPGLWLVPNAYAGAVEDHPDWYLRDREGKLVLDYGTPALDSSHPEVLEFLRKLFGTLGGWGFEYYKFDGEHALPKYAPPVDRSRLYDKSTDPLEIYRHRLKVIRQVVGPNTFIEGCPAGTPLNGVGLFNSYFNGQDVYNNWQGMYALFSSINANAFLNHVVVYVMPGEGIEIGERLTVEEASRKRPAEVVGTARTREEPMIGFGVSAAEARTLVSVVSLSGVVYPLAGVMPELPPERLSLLQRTMPTMPIMPLDLFSRGTDVEWGTFKHIRPDEYIHHYPEVLDLKVNAISGAYDVVALPNWRSAPVGKTLSFSRQLGLDPTRKYLGFDFWNQKLLGTFSGQMSVQIDGHDTRVVLLHPLLDRPQLLGCSRHITGAFSIQEVAWDAGSRTLHGVSEVVPGEEYSLFIHLPSEGAFDPQPSARAGTNALTIRQDKSGELLTLSVKSDVTLVNWQVRF